MQQRHGRKQRLPDLLLLVRICRAAEDVACMSADTQEPSKGVQLEAYSCWEGCWRRANKLRENLREEAEVPLEAEADGRRERLEERLRAEDALKELRGGDGGISFQEASSRPEKHWQYLVSVFFSSPASRTHRSLPRNRVLERRREV